MLGEDFIFIFIMARRRSSQHTFFFVFPEDANKKLKCYCIKAELTEFVSMQYGVHFVINKGLLVKFDKL